MVELLRQRRVLSLAITHEATSESFTGMLAFHVIHLGTIFLTLTHNHLEPIGMGNQ